MTFEGDEGGILLEFLNARLPSNSANWPVGPMGTDPSQGGNSIGFSMQQTSSTPIVGGETAYSDFLVTVLCIGQLDVDNIDALRPVAIELGNNLIAKGNEPGLIFSGGRVLYCMPTGSGAGPVTMPDKTSVAGRVRWYHGHRWNVRIQPRTS